MRRYKAMYKTVHYFIEIGEESTKSKHLISATALARKVIEIEEQFIKINDDVADTLEGHERDIKIIELEKVQTFRIAINFLATKDSVKKTGFVSRADFNTLLDLLEEKLNTEANAAVEAVRSAERSSSKNGLSD